MQFLVELDKLDSMMPAAMRNCNQVKCNQRLITQSSKAFLNIPIKSLNNTKIHCERIEMLPQILKKTFSMVLDDFIHSWAQHVASCEFFLV